MEKEVSDKDKMAKARILHYSRNAVTHFQSSYEKLIAF
jgi:hypothetical protein